MKTRMMKKKHQTRMVKHAISARGIEPDSSPAAALIASEMRYRRLFESAQDGILILDAETGIVEDVNPFLLDLLGYPYIDFVGKAIWDLGFFSDIVANQGRFSELQQKQYIRYEDKPLKTVDGRQINVEFISNVYLVENKKVIQCNIRDITQRKLAENALQESEAHLRQAQKMETVGRLAGGVAHDYNNMLQIILGYTELAMTGVDPSETLFSDLLEIQKAAQRSAQLTQQLLAFARKQVIEPRILNLNENISQMLNMLQRLLREEIQIDWCPDENLRSVRLDPVQIDQILVNLCLNAQDAIVGNGKIILKTENITLTASDCADQPEAVPGNYVLLSISDNGSGMNHETMAHLFEPFFTTKVVGKGTGLGLATVYGIVKQNNGFICVDSQPEHGTTFKIYLPQMEVALAEPSNLPESPVNHGETILLVEDEPALCQICTLFLGKLGYTVLSAVTPKKALAIAEQHLSDIDLLLTDVILPEMDGRQLSEKIRTIYPEISVLFMSGYTADVIEDYNVQDNDAAFIAKPFTQEELADKVYALLKLRKTTAGCV